MSEGTEPWDADGAGGAPTEAQLAWGNEPEPDRPVRRVSWPLVLSVGVAMVACGTATALAITGGHRSPPSPPAAPPPITITTTAPPVTITPAPVTATVTATVPAPTTVVQYTRPSLPPGVVMGPDGIPTPAFMAPRPTRPPLPPGVCLNAAGVPIPVPIPGYHGGTDYGPCADDTGR